MTRLCILIISVAFSLQLAAQKFINPLSKFSKDADSTETDKNGGILIVPLLYYTPDTRLAAGAMGVYYFHLGIEDENHHLTRLSYIKLLADYTQNRQLDIWSSWNVFTNEEKYLFKGELRFRDFPDRFYGIGNNISKAQEERFEYNLFSFKMLMLRKLGRKVFTGIDLSYENEFNFKLSPNGELVNGNILGFNGGVALGPGFVFIVDTRDNVINSSKGYLFEASSFFYNNSLGSTFNYNKLILEYSKFIQINPKAVLAFNAKTHFSEGEVPFLDMPKMGSDQILRGYPSYRFRDKNMAAAQAEWRQQVYRRWGFVTFAGLGDVFSSEMELRADRLKYSLGAGLRFMVDKNERLNIRIDYGIGRQSDGFYVMLTEAF